MVFSVLVVVGQDKPSIYPDPIEIRNFDRSPHYMHLTLMNYSPFMHAWYSRDCLPCYCIRVPYYVLKIFIVKLNIECVVIFVYTHIFRFLST